MPSHLPKLFVRNGSLDPLNIFVKGPFKRDDKIAELRELIHDYGGKPLPFRAEDTDIILVTHPSKEATDTAMANARTGCVTLDYLWVDECIRKGVLLGKEHRWGKFAILDLLRQKSASRQPHKDESIDIDELSECDRHLQMDVDPPTVDSPALPDDDRFEPIPSSVTPPRSLLTPLFSAKHTPAHAPNISAPFSALPQPWTSHVAAPHLSTRGGTAPPDWYSGAFLRRLSSRTRPENLPGNFQPATLRHDYHPPQPHRNPTPGPSLASPRSQGNQLLGRQHIDSEHLLFTYHDEETGYLLPKKMHVILWDPLQRMHVQMIEKNGGLVVELDEAEMVFINPDYDGPTGSPYPELTRVADRLLVTTWIEDCCGQGQLLLPGEYYAHHYFPHLRLPSLAPSMEKGKETRSVTQKATGAAPVEALSPSSSGKSSKTPRFGKISHEELRQLAEYKRCHPFEDFDGTSLEYWQAYSDTHSPTRSAEAWQSHARRNDREIEDLNSPPLPRLRSRARKHISPKRVTRAAARKDDQKKTNYTDDDDEEDEGSDEEDEQDDYTEDDEMRPDSPNAMDEGKTFSTPGGPCQGCQAVRVPCVISNSRNLKDPSGETSPCNRCSTKKQGCVRLA